MPPCVVKGFRHRRNQLPNYIKGFPICQGYFSVFFGYDSGILVFEVVSLNILKKGLLFLLGGMGYVAMELIYRGRSHISMFAAGGLCFLLIGALEHARPRLPGPLRALAGAGIITMVELAVGLAVNRDYMIWDYRAQPGNFCGQICPRFCLLWIPIAAVAGLLYRKAENAL